MKVQHRQSLYSSIAFGVVFIVLSLIIYMLYSESGKKATYKNLRKTASIIALFHLEEDELNAKEFEKVRIQFDEIVSGTPYLMINEHDSIFWGNKDNNISATIIELIRDKGQLDFSTEKDYCHGIFYEDNQGDFVIITKEPKHVLNGQLISLLWILITALVVGLITVILLSRWLASIAYKPFRQVIEQVKNVSFSNPDTQIDLPGTSDELQELTETFNHLLKRISDTFIIQKNFVSYVSHEFRTPLAAMLGNLEVFSLKERSRQEHEQLSLKLITQIHQLEEILDTLIIISDLRKNMDVNGAVRIDELIWEIIEKTRTLYTNPDIHVRIDIQPNEEHLLTVNKDRTQLLMALFNIIENAVKYSQGKFVDIELYKGESNALVLSVRDRGIGIPAEDLENISKPFYRAENTNKVKGSGIGLSIALRILEKNGITYKIESKINAGTKVIINVGENNRSETSFRPE